VADDASQPGGLRTIERALRVLEIVAEAPSAPTIKDLAATLNHNLSSTYNVVNTLIGAGYLTKDPTGNLRVGSRVAILNRALERDNDYARMLRPFVAEVSASSGETVYLTRFSGGRVSIELVLEGRQSLRVTGLAVGFSGSEDHRASGKAVMAYLPDPSIRAILELNHPLERGRKIDDRVTELRPVLDAIRDQGFAFDDEDFEEGICCVAAPYFDVTGAIVGSLSASGPAVRRAELRGPIRDAVVATAKKMSEALGAENQFSASE
jgi:IclR family acetate operon transcriptional repressor